MHLLLWVFGLSVALEGGIDKFFWCWWPFAVIEDIVFALSQLIFCYFQSYLLLGRGVIGFLSSAGGVCLVWKALVFSAFVVVDLDFESVLLGCVDSRRVDLFGG